MRGLKVFATGLFLLLVMLMMGLPIPNASSNIKDRSMAALVTLAPFQAAMEAPTGFDNMPNGLVDQATHDMDREKFAEIVGPEEGLGPLFDGGSCATCHSNPITGGNSQFRNLRVGRFDGSRFIEHIGGTLISSQAVDPAIQQQAFDNENVRIFRRSQNLLGLGFVEAIDDNTLIAIARSQPQMSGGKIAGQVNMVSIAEAPGKMQVGRFGWKNSMGSLLTFAGFAYVAEVGLTTPLFPTERNSDGRSVAPFDMVPDPEQEDEDNEIFARFIRATKAPPRDTMLASTTDAITGQQLFNDIGCAICHVPQLTTAAPGTMLNGGTFEVPPALGNKIIRPFSDFLLHDIGSGDGIVENGDQSTRNKIRTSPLWGLRTQNQFMHDGLSLTLTDAILRHGGEARVVIRRFRRLSDTQKQQLLTFLRSL
ncbi:MAG: di-heme oxidoredictase family protein [Acidobacteriota bacterium]